MMEPERDYKLSIGLDENLGLITVYKICFYSVECIPYV